MTARYPDRAKLVFSDGVRSSVVPLLSSRPQTVGSDPENAIPLSAPGVADHHCVLIPCAQGHRLVALESFDALCVNGRVTREVLLRPFDRLRIGSAEAIYLPPHADPQELTGVFSRPCGRTQSSPDPDTSRLRQRLLWLLLMIQEVPPGANVSPVLELVFDELLHWTDCDGLFLFVRSGSAEQRELELRRAHRAAPTLDRSRVHAELAPAVARAIERGTPEVGLCPLDEYDAALYLPLTRGGGWLERRLRPRVDVEGALVLTQAQGAPSVGDEELELLEALARQVGVLLGNARLYRLATRDPLTGLACRRSGYAALRAELQHALDQDQPLTCLFVDLDDFKRINDTLGHPTGDRVLQAVARALESALRAEDMVCRWGGEEFLVLLPGTPAESARIVAEKLRAAGRGVYPAQGQPPVTFSIGLAACPDESLRTPDDLVQRADLAMYHAKRAGKDCVVAFSPALADLGQAYLGCAPPADGAEGPAWVLECAWFPPLRLGQGSWRLGRSPENDVVLNHASVSRRHGQLVVDRAGKLFYLDASTNGSTLNGEPLRDAVRVRSGDTLRIGPFEIRVRYDDGKGDDEANSTWIQRADEQERERLARKTTTNRERPPSGAIPAPVF
ncbi:MAG: diguanylate cyclase [Planctomycetota bacterium]